MVLTIWLSPLLLAFHLRNHRLDTSLHPRSHLQPAPFRMAFAQKLVILRLWGLILKIKLLLLFPQEPSLLTLPLQLLLVLRDRQLLMDLHQLIDFAQA